MQRLAMRRDVLLLVAIALLLRLPAFFASRSLLFDDGVYGASAVAMRHGAEPFREVFSSQGPLFLPLVWLFDLFGLHTLNGPRLLSLVAGAAVAVAVYFAARELTDRGGALLAGGLAASSGCLLWVTGPLTSDGITEAFATTAVAVALAYRRAPSTRKAVVIGLCAGAAFAIKLAIIAPTLLVAGLLVLGRRRYRDAALVVVVAVAVAVAAAAPWGFQHVWDQAVLYHTGVAAHRDPGANLAKTWSTLADRDLPLLLAAACALIASLSKRFGVAGLPPGKASDAKTQSVALIWLWLGLMVLVLLAQEPMWRNHLSHLIPPAAILVGVYRPSWKVLAVAAVVAIPYWTVHTWPLLHPEPYRGRAAVVEHALRSMPNGAQAISDEPGLIWRAGRETPPELVDTSQLRIAAKYASLRITPETIAAAAAQPRVCAVVVWSPRFSGDLHNKLDIPRGTQSRFTAFRRLPQLLDGRGYGVVRHFDDEHVLYLKNDCRD